MAAEPFTLQASLVLAPDDGQPNATIDYSFGGQFEHKVVQKLELSGTGSHTVGFGTVGSPGAKAIFLEYLNNAASGLSPVQLTVNGGSDTIEVSPGGCFLYCNPTAASGITGMAIAHTSACTIRVSILR